MRDETSIVDLHRNQSGRKPSQDSTARGYIRPELNYRLGMVDSPDFSFDENTRRELRAHLLKAKPTLSEKTADDAIHESEAVANNYIIWVLLGSDRRRAPRRKTNATLAQIRRTIERLDRLKQPRKSESREWKRIGKISRQTAALAKLLRSESGALFSDVEQLLVEHGWPEYWDQRTISCLPELRVAVEAAQQTVARERPGSGGTALRSQRRGTLHLAHIWVKTTRTTAGRSSDRYGDNVSAFASFARIALDAAGTSIGRVTGRKYSYMRTVQDLTKHGLLPEPPTNP